MLGVIMRCFSAYQLLYILIIVKNLITKQTSLILSFFCYWIFGSIIEVYSDALYSLRPTNWTELFLVTSLSFHDFPLQQNLWWLLFGDLSYLCERRRDAFCLWVHMRKKLMLFPLIFASKSIPSKVGCFWHKMPKC